MNSHINFDAMPDAELNYIMRLSNDEEKGKLSEVSHKIKAMHEDWSLWGDGDKRAETRIEKMSEKEVTADYAKRYVKLMKKYFPKIEVPGEDIFAVKAEMDERLKSKVPALTNRLQRELADKKSSDIIKMLLEAGAQPTDTTLEVAISSKATPKVIKILIKAGTPIPAGIFNTAVLHKASKEVFKILIDAGAKPEEGTANLAYNSHLSNSSISLLREEV